LARPLRDADYLSEIGFEIEIVQRRKWGIVERTVARKPQAGTESQLQPG
jgi:hypothetical protein